MTNNKSTVQDPVGKRTWIILLVICLASVAGHLFIYPSLPETIPTHWDINGNANDWGPKSTQLILAFLPLLMMGLMYLTPKMDPRGANFDRFGNLYRGFSIAMTLFMVMASWVAELTVIGVIPQENSPVGILITGTLGVIFIALGNYMPRIKQNYTFGCKTPWAIHNEQNWNLTHRFCGKAFIVMGVAMIFTGIFGRALGNDLAGGVLMAIILGGCALTYVYSYLVFRHGNRPLHME